MRLFGTNRMNSTDLANRGLSLHPRVPLIRIGIDESIFRHGCSKMDDRFFRHFGKPMTTCVRPADKQSNLKPRLSTPIPSQSPRIYPVILNPLCTSPIFRIPGSFRGRKPGSPPRPPEMPSEPSSSCCFPFFRRNHKPNPPHTKTRRLSIRFGGKEQEDYSQCIGELESLLSAAELRAVRIVFGYLAVSENGEGWEGKIPGLHTAWDAWDGKEGVNWEAIEVCLLGIQKVVAVVGWELIFFHLLPDISRATALAFTHPPRFLPRPPIPLPRIPTRRMGLVNFLPRVPAYRRFDRFVGSGGTEEFGPRPGPFCAWGCEGGERGGAGTGQRRDGNERIE